MGTAGIANVPTPAMMAQVTDPTSLALLQQYQVPTSPTGTLSESRTQHFDTYEWAERGDFVLTHRDLMWMRYAVYDSNTFSTGNTFISSNLPYFGASSVNHPREATFAETHTFDFGAVNEFRFGFGQSKPSFPIQTPYPLGPALSFLDGSVTGLGVSSALPQGREQRTYEYTDNFSITKGTHTLKTALSSTTSQPTPSSTATSAAHTRLPIGPRLPPARQAPTRRILVTPSAITACRTRSPSFRTTGESRTT